MAVIHSSLFLMVCLTVVSAQNVINRVVTAQCYKSSNLNTLTTNFKTVLNGDEINYLQGLELMAGSNPEMYTIDTDCIPYWSDDNGTLSMETVIDLTGAAAHSSPCGVREVYSDTNPSEVIGYTWRIGLRYWENTYASWRDRDYVWTCNIDTATDTWLTTSINVNAPGPVNLDPILPTITLSVIRNGVAVQSCEVGQLLQLQLKLYITNFPSTNDDTAAYPTGVYGYNTYVHWEPISNPSTLPLASMLLGEDGCANAGNRLALEQSNTGGIREGFTEKTIDDLTGRTGINNADFQFIARTKHFRCRKYPDKNLLFFITTAAVCFGPWEPQGQSDKKCVDVSELCVRKPTIWVPTRSDTNWAVQLQKMYCKWGPDGRRRREVLSHGNYTEVMTSIRVIDETDKQSEAEASTGSTALLIVAPIVGILVIITAIIGVMMCCWTSRRMGMRKRRLDSRASSDSSIPRKF